MHTLPTPMFGVIGARIGASLAAGLAGQGLLIVSGVLVARMLGLEGRGQLALIALVPSILAQLGSLGLPFATTYFIAQNRFQKYGILRQLAPVVGVQCVTLLALHGLILLVALPSQSRDVQLAGLVSLPAIPALMAMQFGLAILQGEQRFRRLSMVRVVPGGLYALALVVSLAGDGNSVPFVVGLWVASNVFGGAFLLVAALRGVSGVAAGGVPKRREMLAFGLRGHLGSLSLLETMPLDQLVVGILCGPAALGLYVVATAFTNLPRLIGHSVGLVAYPAMGTRPAGRDSTRTLWKFTGLATALSIVPVAVIALLAPILIPTFFGEAFAESEDLLLLLLPGALFYGVRRTHSAAVSGMGRPGLNSASELSSWLTFLLVLIVIGPGANGEGVAVAMSLAAATSICALIALALAWKSGSPSLPSGVSMGNLFPGSSAAWRLAPFLALAPFAGASVTLLPTTLVVAGLGLCGGAVALFGFRRFVRTEARIESGPAAPASDAAEEADDTLRIPRALYYVGLLFIGQLIIRPAFATTLSDVFFVASFGLTVLAARKSRSRQQGLPRALVVGILFFAAGAILASAAATAPIDSAVIAAKFVYLSLGWFWLSLRLLRTEHHVRRAMTFWTLSVGISGVAAVAQYIWGDVIPNASPAWGRMTGTGDHVNDLGGMAAIALVPSFVLARGSLKRSIRLIVPAFVLAGLLLSGAVAAMMAAGVATIVWFLITGVRFRSLLLVSVLAAVGFGVFNIQGDENAATPLERFERVTGPEDDPNATFWTRFDTFELALLRFESSPVIGTGLDAESSELASGFEAHNILLGPLYRAGIFGGVGMAMILFAIGRSGRRALRAFPESQRPLMAALFSSFLAFVAFGMSAPILYQRYGWVAAAVLLAYGAQPHAHTAGAVIQQRIAQRKWRDRANRLQPFSASEQLSESAV